MTVMTVTHIWSFCLLRLFLCHKHDHKTVYEWAIFKILPHHSFIRKHLWLEESLAGLTSKSTLQEQNVHHQHLFPCLNTIFQRPRRICSVTVWLLSELLKCSLLFCVSVCLSFSFLRHLIIATGWKLLIFKRSAFQELRKTTLFLHLFLGKRDSLKSMDALVNLPSEEHIFLEVKTLSNYWVTLKEIKSYLH